MNVLEQEKAAHEGLQDTSGIPWFLRTHPQFDTQEVERARKATLESPFLHKRETSIAVTRRLTKSRTTHVLLRIDEKTKAFSIKCLQLDIVLQVERSQILSAVAEVHNSEWVCLRLDNEVLRLKRAELRAAFHKLEKL